MGIKKEWKNLKKGYKELQRRSRKAQALAEAKNLQKARDERIRREAQALRAKKLMQERIRITKAKATIQKGRGQGGLSKGVEWFLGTGATQKRTPIKRAPIQRKNKYFVKGGVAYPVMQQKNKTHRAKPKRKKSLMDEYNALLR